MKYVSVLALVVCGVTTACTVKTERTVVERPAAAPTAVVYTDAAPASSTVYVPVQQ